ncbi:MAG: hypothetical protein Q4G43_03480 [Mobilicoccus sp.]|nr:hypothetical protein [Mobilicoccus sp.]
MATQPTPTDEVTPADEIRYQSIVFLNAVVPVLRPIVEATPSLRRAFAGLTGVVQISALADDGTSVDGRPPRVATHIVVQDGELSMHLGPHRAPSVELQFGSRSKLNAFFLGKPVAPKIRGAAGSPRLLVATVRSLLAMSSLLGSAEPPTDPERARLLVKAMFYLLTTGISQLTKAGHPRFRQWARSQPDRIYQLEVAGADELAAYVRVKGGRTKAVRGPYTYARPFFTMQFDSPRSALGILLEVDDMIESTMAGHITMLGAPEYGAELGELMLTVGGYAK